MSRLLAVALVVLPFAESSADEPYSPPISGRSNEGRNAIQSFQIPEGIKAELVAAEPDLANPVCFAIDEKGRFYVGETFRQKKGVEDNRSHMNWLHDDLAAQSVADRVAFFRKHLGDKVEAYAREHDRIRLLEDTDGDGVVDKATVFADGFNRIEDGTGAGLLARNGDVFYTCIPDLWKLRDENGDGVADQRESLHTGYGVRVAFRGHDMHGLVTGPDGRLYFSIGDRGYNVTTKEGERLDRPDTGAVFRCEPDGSQLEVFAYGLRNPQELAFDDFGNLFTGDNNSDSGDKARWVHVLKGSDTGWRMYFQYLKDRGPWNREMMWYPIDEELKGKGPGNVPAGSKARELQPAYIVPPVANLADGPSGLVAYPGVGLSDRYDGHFFLCDFRGNAARSGIRSFAVKPKGASFELVDSHQFLWRTLVTDVDFGYDGAMYATDWVAGWDGPGKGRLYRFFDAEHRSDAEDVAALFAAGFDELKAERLFELLDHDDRRVRQRAHLELSERTMKPVAPGADIEAKFGAADEPEGIYGKLQEIVYDQRKPVRTRWHALVALGRFERLTHCPPDELMFGVLLADAPEIRVQALRNAADHPGVLEWTFRGEGEPEEVANDTRYVTQALRDRDAHVRRSAAMLLGKCGFAEDVPELLALADREEDPAIRHGVVMGLTGIAERHPGSLEAALEHPGVRGRTAVVVALRRLKSPTLARFLRDAVPAVQLEAARAINDVPLGEGVRDLAELAGEPLASEALVRRVMNANYRLGGESHAMAVAAFAADDTLSEALRLEAVEELRTWGEPTPTDRVTGRWAPLDERDAEVAKPAVRGALGSLLAASPPLRKAGVTLAAAYGIKDVGPTLLSLVRDGDQPAAIRAESLAALDAIGFDGLRGVAETALKADPAPEVRIAARRVLVRLVPNNAATILDNAIGEFGVAEQQDAIAQLAKLNRPGVGPVRARLFGQLEAGTLPASIQLDVLELAATRDDEPARKALAAFEAARPKDALGPYVETIEGGDVARGETIFFGRSAASCRRCHMVQGSGGIVGPNLSAIGKEKDRRYLLESLVNPNAKIAKGFETVVVATIEGKVHAGIVKGETDDTLTLMKPDGQLVVVPQDDIDDRAPGKSGMPEDIVKQLSKADLRDLVAYLASCRTPQKDAGHTE